MAQKPTIWVPFRVLSLSPLITVSAANIGKIPLFEIAARAGGDVLPSCGLHFISLTWNLGKARAAAFARTCSAVKAAYPGHEFLVMANSRWEQQALEAEGVSAIHVNNSMFQDDRDWTVCRADEGDGAAQFDALYNACLSPFKRHELCSDLDALMLIYGINPRSEDDAADLARVRALLPGAYFSNHEMNDGQYRFMTPEALCRLHGRAGAALCLSAEEGYMRASIQALLCGLGVVSTSSIGGRDQYYAPDYALIVDPDPAAVRRGVDEIRARDLPREEVRAAVMAQLERERVEAVAQLRAAAGRVFGSDAPELSFEDLRGVLNRARSEAQIRDMLGAAQIAA